MATGKRIKHYRIKAGWTLADLSEASGVEVGTISALENRDSKRSENFAPIARAFGLTVEQLADESTDFTIFVPDLTSLGQISVSPLIPLRIRKLPGKESQDPQMLEALSALTKPAHDKWTLEAIDIMQSLDEGQKFAMLAKMREFKQHLNPPRFGQAL